ncbi:type II secretion system F family protein [bacterium]|nr:type II secretion system F family protein [bacterium]
MILLRCFATAFGAGVPLVACLELLARQCQDRRLGVAFRQASQRLQSGQPLSKALRAQRILNDLQCRLIEISERTGSLHAALEKLAFNQEQLFQQELNLRRSLTLPALTLGACLLLVTIAPCLLFEGIFGFLRESQLPLPWPTRWVMALAGLFRQPGFWLVGLAGAAILGPRLQPRLQSLLGKLPLYSRLVRRRSLHRFTQSMGLMLELGMPLLESLELAGRSTGQAEFEQASHQVAELVKQGHSVPAALNQSPECFPASLVQAAQAGEECGRLPELLLRLCDLYELELELAIGALTRAAEPLILCLVGGIVGFTVVATMLPLVELLNRF